MEKLNINQYHKVIKPLSALKFNTCFAVMVVEKRASGDVYVDNPDHPAIFIIRHTYGMSLLFGDWQKENEHQALKDYMTNRFKNRNSSEWMQVYPRPWEDVIEENLADCFVNCEDLAEDADPNAINDKIVRSTRLNFKFNLQCYMEFRKNFVLDQYNIVPTTGEMFGKISGSVVPKKFWEDEKQFLNNGYHFSLIIGDDIASTAFTSYTVPGKLEIGIETMSEYRGLGYGTLVASKLIDCCIQHNLEPVWSCNMINTGSQALANKLGFEKTVTLPYYKMLV